MATTNEQSSDGKRHYRRTADCSVHGETSPAYETDDFYKGDVICIRCEIDRLQAIHDEGGEAGWEWLPDAETPAKRMGLVSCSADAALLYSHMIARNATSFSWNGPVSGMSGSNG